MKVLCIQTSCGTGDPDIADVIEGQVYTVIQTVDCPCGCGKDSYVLEEMDSITAYSSIFFVPISDQENLQLTEEEAETIRQRQSKPVLI